MSKRYQKYLKKCEEAYQSYTKKIKKNTSLEDNMSYHYDYLEKCEEYYATYLQEESNPLGPIGPKGYYILF